MVGGTRSAVSIAAVQLSKGPFIYVLVGCLVRWFDSSLSYSREPVWLVAAAAAAAAVVVGGFDEVAPNINQTNPAATETDGPRDLPTDRQTK